MRFRFAISFPPAINFPPGRVLLMLSVVALATGGWIALRPTSRPADLRIWTFSQSHADAYRAVLTRDAGAAALNRGPTPPTRRPVDRYASPAPGGEGATRDVAANPPTDGGPTVAVNVIGGRALNVLVESLFITGRSSTASPDLVEIEISSIGRFLHPPAGQIGFLPLNDRLRQSGWGDRLLPARLRPWSKNGIVYGVPQDVHPVALLYNAKLFQEVGLDLASATTWREFHGICLQFQQRWRQAGVTRWALQLDRGSADVVAMMLLQRGLNLVDEDDTLHYDDPRVAQTLAFYATLVAGPGRIGEAVPKGDAATLHRDLTGGVVCGVVAPDWLAQALRDTAPQLAGVLRGRALPVFDPGDAPTSTWGGTMLGIPRTASDPDAAWQLIERLLAGQADAASHVLPAVPELWDHPRYQQPDAYFGGQKIDTLYIRLARRVPGRVVTPYTAIAIGRLSLVLGHATDLAEQGTDEVAIAAAIAPDLQTAAADIRRLIQFSTLR